MKTITRTLLALLLLISWACQKEEHDLENHGRISGLVQKGPFLEGGIIELVALDDDLEKTAKAFTSEISENNGSYTLTRLPGSLQFAEITATGFYFDEVKGKVTETELSLSALVDVSEAKVVNINVLTHLERPRILELVGQGMGFEQASSQAQAEVLAVFGYHNPGMIPSRFLNIGFQYKDNAYLLATSLIIQGNRNPEAFAKFMDEIAADLAGNGKLDNQALFLELRKTAIGLYASEIRQHLAKRFQILGMNANVPDFESPLSSFIAFSAQAPYVRTEGTTDISSTSAILWGIVNPESSAAQVFFEYGPDDSYGFSVAVQEGNPVEGVMNNLVNAPVADLSPGTTYHYRIRATNAQGTVYGEARSFTTKTN